MNPCHVCYTIPKKQLIISCDNCTNQYCLKCIKAHISEPSVQKIHQINNIQVIKQRKTNHKWLCFKCLNACICSKCKGNSILNIQKQLLGQKQKIVFNRKIQDYSKHLSQINLLNKINTSQLSPFEQQYFINKAMLYCRQKQTTYSTKKGFTPYIMKNLVQKNQLNQNVINIDSDQNIQGPQVIQEQENQQKYRNELNEQVAMQSQIQSNTNQLFKNPQVIQVQQQKQNSRMIDQKQSNQVINSNNVQKGFSQIQMNNPI